MNTTINAPNLDAHAIPSPALLFFPTRIKENIERMIDTAGDPARLRPHIKTHKCAEVVQMKRELGISKFKCATLAEINMLAQAGAKDILMAYQPIGPNVGLLLALIKDWPDVAISCIIDHAQALDQLSSAAKKHGASVPVYLDFDVGMRRTGIRSLQSAVDLVLRIDSAPGIHFAGIHAYDGHHGKGDVSARADEASETVLVVEQLCNALTAAEVNIDEIVMGGTPMFPLYSTYPNLTLSPGTLILNDYTHFIEYPDMPYAIGAMILSRVISLPSDGAFTLDAGAKANSVDHPDKAKLISLPSAKPELMSEEHWQFTCGNDDLPSIGDEMLLVPAHICTAVHHYDRAYVIDDSGKCVGTWSIAARGRILGLIK